MPGEDPQGEIGTGLAGKIGLGGTLFSAEKGKCRGIDIQFLGGTDGEDQGLSIGQRSQHGQ